MAQQHSRLHKLMASLGLTAPGGEPPDALTLVIQRLEERVGDLERQLHTRATIFGDCSPVDLVDFGEYLGFMFTGDSGYAGIPEAQRKHAVTEQDLVRRADPAGQPLSGALRRNLLLALFQCLWDGGVDFSYLDVGTRYGLGLVEAGLIVARNGQRNQLFGFDPGPTASLVPHTLSINGLERWARFFPCAVGRASHPGIVVGELGASENSGIDLRRTFASGHRAWVVPVISLDEFCAARVPCDHLIVKIDTQGTEPDVVHGMRRLLASRCVACIIEVSPGARPEADVAFLQEHFTEYTTLDLGQIPHGDPLNLALGIGPLCNAVPADGLPQLLKEIRNRKYGWSDVLFLPPTFPNRERVGPMIRELIGGSR